jgi:two-component system alkaline phosphatase synthesis response regulator PhoP
MRQELIEASKAFDNPQAFLLGAQWMENYLNPLPTDNIVINSSDFTVSFEGRKLFLPKKEFELLRYLHTHSGRIVTREELLERVWNNEFIGDRTVDVHIRKLRSKINIVPIRTIKAVGYIWDKNI